MHCKAGKVGIYRNRAGRCHSAYTYWGIGKPAGLLATLRKPIDFDSIDDLPVDIVFVLLTPDQEPNKHLNVLAFFSRKLRSPGVLDQMRAAKDAQSLYARFVAEP